MVMSSLFCAVLRLGCITSLNKDLYQGAYHILHVLYKFPDNDSQYDTIEINLQMGGINLGRYNFSSFTRRLL